MNAVAYRWSDIEADNPIELLTRQRILGDQILVANVKLKPGCVVAVHHHVSEQIAIILSGHVRWTVDGKEIEMRGGEVLVIPSNVPHGVLALEETHVIDLLSPPGAMGVDSQRD